MATQQNRTRAERGGYQIFNEDKIERVATEIGPPAMTTLVNLYWEDLPELVHAAEADS